MSSSDSGTPVPSVDAPVTNASTYVATSPSDASGSTAGEHHATSDPTALTTVNSPQGSMVDPMSRVPDFDRLDSRRGTLMLLCAGTGLVSADCYTGDQSSTLVNLGGEIAGLAVGYALPEILLRSVGRRETSGIAGIRRIQYASLPAIASSIITSIGHPTSTPMMLATALACTQQSAFYAELAPRAAQRAKELIFPGRRVISDQTDSQVPGRGTGEGVSNLGTTGRVRCAGLAAAASSWITSHLSPRSEPEVLTTVLGCTVLSAYCAGYAPELSVLAQKAKDLICGTVPGTSIATDGIESAVSGGETD